MSVDAVHDFTIESGQKSYEELTLFDKVMRSKMLIIEWYEQFERQVYCSFSGGKDSRVLLHIIRSVYPDVEAVFCDTSLEYPEIKKFVKTFDNVRVMRPKRNFAQVLKSHGFPIVSKMVSMAINRWQVTKDPVQKELRKWGGLNPNTGKMQHQGVIPKKWHFILDHDIKVTEQCCYFFKKEPFIRYEKETGKKPFIGLMASESNARVMSYQKDGCNAFHLKKPQSRPLMFWNEKNIYDYVSHFKLKLAEVYYSRVVKDPKTGLDITVPAEKRTGCIFCMYGVHFEDPKNTRFHRLQKTHPKLYDYCMDKLGLRKVLKIYTGVDYE